MKILKDYTFSWKQMAIFKVCLLSIGVAIGSYWSEFFIQYITLLIILGPVLGIYLGYVAFKNK